MKKVFVSQLLVEVEALKEVLEGAGIRCMVKNRQGSSLAGEVPFAEVFPELWVNDEDETAAAHILASQKESPPIEGRSWTCLGCGERHDASFTACWKCGRQRDNQISK
ncbi:hypothetical protein YTPLAS18_35170 [Nitrospira sp.]|nr:hypothetical protein YTPLAS18_35170 [Nitrospira sp.]